MKNTVKLEQFVALKEKDLQKIKGGEMRLSKFFRDFILQRKPKFQVEVSHPKEIHLATCSPSIF
ncbi:competence stimulating peptide 2 [Streptococcus pneumoniae]|nr:competence stimulating peptide 2 [Streptococcus pneumoniae]